MLTRVDATRSSSSICCAAMRGAARTPSARCLSGWLALGALASLACSPDRRPNVLLVTIDTLRADYLGSYGFPHPTSPRIDALAASGVLFERAIAASSTTSPSHASILTSLRTREHSVGFMSGVTQLLEPTLAERFREAGFATAAFVGNVNLGRRLGFARGFDHYDDDLAGAVRNRPLQRERIAEHTNERALAWLAARADAPLFLWVHYQDPHGPYEAPPGLARRFQLGPIAGEAPLPVLDSNSGRRGIPRYQALPGLSLPSQYRGRYADEILYADHYVGELVAALDAHPSGREAVVLLTADHGELMGEGNRFFFHPLNSTPPLAHVPFILRAPGLAPGRRRDLVGHLDVLPTLLELAGLPIPASARGLALGPALREGRALPDRLVLCDAGNELSAYRDGSFVRVVGIKRPWLRRAPAREPEWGAYRWDADGVFAQLEDPDEERRRVDQDHRELAAYFRSAVDMEKAPPADAEDLERLRALGYLD